jgi:hypothetical protein
MGAVNKPDALTVPDVAAHATVVFEVLITVAVNCWVFPETTVAVEGEAEMLTALALDDTLAPPQPARISRPENNREARKKNQPGSLFRRGFEPFSGSRKTRGSGGQVRCAIPVQSSNARN